MERIAYGGEVDVLLVVGDLALGMLIVNKVAYTEIDWVAYMQEVEGVVLRGEYDYTKLEGDTGPLVYPAGFVYVFALLRWLTDGGLNIRRAQYMFALAHTIVVALLLACFRQVRKESGNQAAPFWLGIQLVVSRRVHSIFALRLFNDCVAMLLAYLAILLFLKRKWTLGCITYSFALSIKMNIILFAPGLAVVLVQSGGIRVATLRVLMMGAIQVVLALPFLLENPYGYLQRSFDLGRVFLHEWTVNLKFLPEPIFQSRELGVGLLFCTMATWLAFGHFRWASHEGGLVRMVIRSVQESPRGEEISAQHILSCLFTSNFIGIVFSRTLHYQFYSWYYHALGYLCFISSLPLWLGFGIILGIEICFNIYPSTPWSSLVLQGCHVVLLLAIWIRGDSLHHSHSFASKTK